MVTKVKTPNIESVKFIEDVISSRIDNPLSIPEFYTAIQSDLKLTKITKHAKRHFWLNDVCTCHGLLPSHSA